MINQKRLQISSRFQKSFKQKSLRQRVIRYSLVIGNAAILVAVVAFVITSSHGDHPTTAAVLSARDSEVASNPVDGLTSYDIASNVARVADLPEITLINNQAQSARVSLAVSAGDTNVVAKPQILMTALKSRKDIQEYTVQSGDTIASIAQKFGITSDSIKWSNNLTSDAVSLGAKLTLPPTGVSGIVYVVKSGDTVQSLATKYKANADQITAFNDAELSGLQTGEQIIIPNGQIQAAPMARSRGLLGSGGGSYIPQYGGNGYARGYCTFYAADRSGAPNNWGNANTWAYYAALSGWTVSSTPRVGAIAQTSGMSYLGHVAIVEEVSADGTEMKYSDMNGIRGWGNVGYSDWVSVSRFEHYIYR
jgi:N-acetylmuramoyl-L-alanine amidase